MQPKTFISQCTRVLVASLLMSTLLFHTTVAQEAAEEAASVNIVAPAGAVIGRETDAGRAFLGIPYAKPPVGDLRWAAPEPAETWTAPLDAAAFGSECPQTLAYSMTGAEQVSGAEDCLYLNIYTPAAVEANAGLPVMVWIHGGSYEMGAGSNYDGSLLSWENDVIVVTINYRLGALGFYVHPALSADSESHESGNYALMDQQLALKWVQTNIAAFGGDAQNVTIFGESAGGSSVCYQLVSPAAEGLFQKAILQSGLCLSVIGDVSMAEAEVSGQGYAEALGCADETTAAECLRGKPIEDIVLTPSTSVGISGTNSWGAVYGHSLLPLKPAEAFAEGEFNSVPVINGTNHDEGTTFDILLPTLTRNPLTADDYQSRIENTFGDDAAQVMEHYPLENYESPGLAMAAITTDSVFSCTNLRLNGLIADDVPTYAYEFSDPDALFSLGGFEKLFPDMDLGAYHAAEIAYIFRTPQALGDPADFTLEQDALSQQMAAYWVNFARAGDPNGGDLPAWETFDSGAYVQSFAPEAVLAAADFSADHQCDFWASLGE